MSKRSIIKFDGVTFAYGEGRPALRGVSVEIGQGEFVAVIGANGSGKSTFARHVSALLTPSSGSVFVNGVETGGEDRNLQIRRAVGTVFQNPENQSVASRVEDDVAFGPENLGLEPAEIRCRVTAALEAVGMAGFEGREVAHLSGGQKQRVAIAGALAMEPQILVLDEPGAMLDVRGRKALMDIIASRHEEGMTVVLVTHFMEDALAADRVLVMDGGEIALQGAPAEVFAHAGQLLALGLELPFEEELKRRLANGPAQCEPRPERPESEPFVCLDQAGYSYDGERPALEQVSLNVGTAGFLGVAGQTGSGKSTLLKLMNALLVPTEGAVTVGGLSTSKRGNMLAVRKSVGMAFQYPEHQLFASTVAEDLAFGPRNLGVSAEEAARKTRKAMGLVGLDYDEYAQRSPFDLSGGQQRRVALAGILAMEPQVLVLDEPMAGLDPQGCAAMRRLLLELHAGGVGIVLVSHSMDDLAALCSEVAVLDGGRVVLQGVPSQVFSRGNAAFLEQLGLGLPRPAAYALQVGLQGDLPLTVGNLAAALA